MTDKLLDVHSLTKETKVDFLALVLLLYFQRTAFFSAENISKQETEDSLTLQLVDICDVDI